MIEIGDRVISKTAWAMILSIIKYVKCKNKYVFCIWCKHLSYTSMIEIGDRVISKTAYARHIENDPEYY